MAKKSKAGRTKASAVVAEGALIVTLGAAQKKKAEECLKQTGKITMGFKEISVTKLGEMVDADVIIN